MQKKKKKKRDKKIQNIFGLDMKALNKCHG